jgi:hypothetical protein
VPGTRNSLCFLPMTLCSHSRRPGFSLLNHIPLLINFTVTFTKTKNVYVCPIDSGLHFPYTLFKVFIDLFYKLNFNWSLFKFMYFFFYFLLKSAFVLLWLIFLCQVLYFSASHLFLIPLKLYFFIILCSHFTFSRTLCKFLRKLF